MRNIATKIDGNTLPAAAFNSDQDELENAVLSSDQTLDPDAGPDTDLNMLGKTMAAYANAANIYQDSGVADAYVLSLTTNLKPVTKYYDNMMIVFKAGNSSTGASTVNVETLGVKDIELPDGTALGAGDIVSGEYVIAIYSLSDDRFEITVSNIINADTADSVVDQGGGNNLKVKVIDIGDWDMVATVQVSIAHGLTASKIREISALIIADSTAGYFTFDSNNGGASSADATNIILGRTTGGAFDSTTYDATPFNRGWITIWHTE